MSNILIETLGAFRDARGMLFEPLDATGLARQKNAHVVVTRPGEVRGNHRHPMATETIAVIGPCHVRFRDAGAMRDIEVPAGEAWRFTFAPGVPHAFRNTGDQPMVLVSFSTQPFEPTGAGTVREVIL